MRRSRVHDGRSSRRTRSQISFAYYYLQIHTNRHTRGALRHRSLTGAPLLKGHLPRARRPLPTSTFGEGVVLAEGGLRAAVEEVEAGGGLVDVDGPAVESAA